MIQSAASAPGAAGRARVGAHLGLVGQRRLVPMVAVGHEQRLAREVVEQPVVGLDGGQLVEQAVGVARAPLIGPGAAHDVVVALRAVEVDGQDRAELRARGVQEGEPIGLRSRHGVLVRPDAIAPGLQQHAHHDAFHGRLVRAAAVAWR